MSIIPVLSLHQPWASLIAIGAKRYETRSWPAPRALTGRRIAIHAAKTTTSLRQLCDEGVEGGWEHGVIGDFQVGYCVRDEGEGRPGDTFIVEHSGSTWPRVHNETLPLGAIVAIATLHSILGTSSEAALWRTHGLETERPYGDWSPGRWAWRLTDVQALPEPVVFVGGQGFSRSVDLG